MKTINLKFIGVNPYIPNSQITLASVDVKFTDDDDLDRQVQVLAKKYGADEIDGVNERLLSVEDLA